MARVTPDSQSQTVVQVSCPGAYFQSGPCNVAVFGGGEFVCGNLREDPSGVSYCGNGLDEVSNSELPMSIRDGVPLVRVFYGDKDQRVGGCTVGEQLSNIALNRAVVRSVRG